MIKVAGYCRVSTDKDDQSNSFESQQRFFREYIERRSDWQLHRIYADEGITGTSTKRRTEFNRMIRDGYTGAFRLILTKEVSRFSRNILDTIAYTRELKALGIGVVFLSDGFSTLDPDAELRLSIMGSIAQEESRRTSARVKWGQTRQMERGVVFGNSMLGYDVVHGKLTVDPEGAEVVRLIFQKYGTEKKGTTVIARELREAGFKTHRGNAVWSSSHIMKILKNEKYAGDLVQKKTYTPDYLTHEKKYNHGQEDLVILRDHHEPIVSRELWNLVQAEIRRRNRKNSAVTGHSNRYVFSGKIKCAECGASFIMRTRTGGNGIPCKRWGCYTAARYGSRKADIRENITGCDVGKQIRDELFMQMLVYILRNLPLKWEALIGNVSAIAARAVCDYRESRKKPEQKAKQLEAKKARAIDAYLSGVLTEKEVLQIKEEYDVQIRALHRRLEEAAAVGNIQDTLQELRCRAEAIVTCKILSEPFLKNLLEYAVVHKDGSVEMKLRQLDTLWRFRLEKKG